MPAAKAKAMPCLRAKSKARPPWLKPPSWKKKVEQEDNKTKRPPPPTPWRSRAPTLVRKPCPSRAPRQKNKVEHVEDKKTKQKEHTEKARVKAPVCLPWRSRAPPPVREPCPSRAPSQKNKVEQVEDKKTKQKEHTEKAPPEVLQKRATQAKRADTSLQMLCQTLLEFLTYLVRQTWIVRSSEEPGHDEDCRDIVCDTIQSVCHLELVFYDETALLLHKRMLDVMSCNKEGLPKRNIFIQWCRRVQSHNEAVPSSDPVDIFKSLALDLLSNDLTPEQRRDPKYQVIRDKTTREISVTPAQRSWINVILRKNLGHARVAFYIFKHGVPDLFNLPFRRQAPTRALLQSMLQDFMTWHASLLDSILRRPNHPGRANARMPAALGQTKWWMHG